MDNKVIVINPAELRELIAEEVGAAIRKAGSEVPRRTENAHRCDMLSLSEAIEYLRELGYITTAKSLYGKTSRGTVPYRKIGRRVIFSRAKLGEWVAAQTSTPTMEDERRANAAARLSDCVTKKMIKL